MSERDSIAESQFWAKLAGLAKLCNNTELAEEIVELYDLALKPFGYPAVNQALDWIILNRKARDPFPSVGDIRAVLEPEQDPDHQAVLTAGKISEALGKFGWNNESRAKEFIGEAGWEVVRMSGGWLNLCSIESMSALSTHRAQWIRIARAMIERDGPARSGRHEIGRAGGKLIGGKDGGN